MQFPTHIKLLTGRDMVFLHGGNPYKALLFIQQQLLSQTNYLLTKHLWLVCEFHRVTCFFIRLALQFEMHFDWSLYSSIPVRRCFEHNGNLPAKRFLFFFSFKNCMQTRLSTRTFLRRKYHKIEGTGLLCSHPFFSSFVLQSPTFKYRNISL